MSTATTPTVDELGAIIHGLSEAGSFSAIERGVVAELRDALPALGAALGVPADEAGLTVVEALREVLRALVQAPRYLVAVEPDVRRVIDGTAPPVEDGPWQHTPPWPDPALLALYAQDGRRPSPVLRRIIALAGLIIGDQTEAEELWAEGALSDEELLALAGAA